MWGHPRADAQRERSMERAEKRKRTRMSVWVRSMRRRMENMAGVASGMVAGLKEEEEEDGIMWFAFRSRRRSGFSPPVVAFSGPTNDKAIFVHLLISLECAY
eukprot:TRINITY_DN6585_c0_g1_i1.p5 TRINITY_DN6585_c0_g1~~TRINITY_DN6585_c0_g1_i1.p5  ORF type:complete len:102 (-),score=22.12 TRINITY_DN6585_c0_g1_i1:91-396(-)